MTFDDFRDLVRRMRQAQKSYFRDRRTGDLELSKRLERQVDEALTDAGQGDMFGKGDEK